MSRDIASAPLGVCWFRTCARDESRHLQELRLLTCLDVEAAFDRLGGHGRGMCQADAARLYGVSEATVSRLLARYRTERDGAFEPRSRRPGSSPTRTPTDVVALIVNLRVDLSARGLDAGPVTIRWHLERHHGVTVSVSTIRRRLVDAGLINPEPKKRPPSGARLPDGRGSGLSGRSEPVAACRGRGFGADRKVSMTVLKQHHAPGMPAEVYDQVAAGAMPSQSKADGFVAHYAIVEDGGITVIEIWDSIAQHDAWFNEVVKPHLPPDTPEPKFAEMHNSNTKQ